MKKLHLLPVLISVLITLIIFWQIPIKGKVPFPGHLLVGRLFPWNQQQWQGYPLGVPYKEFFAADTVRQTYPWRQLAINQLKQGELPWWNPYTFTGNPLLANLQSAPFYPLNLLYLFGQFDSVWIFQVLLQPILSILFTYLFARSLKLSRLSSFFAGLTFAFSGYMTIWLELNTVGHAALWLPLALYLINRGFGHPKNFLLLSAPFISSLLAGHLQSSLYLLTLSTAYFLWQFYSQQKNLKQKNLHLIYFFVSIAITLSLISIQLLPALKLYSLSPRFGADSDIFRRFLLPYSHLLTFIAPNFFGNPARGNFWGQDYGEFMAYFGIIPLVLFLAQFFSPKKTKTQKFFLSVTIICLLFMLPNPVAYLPKILNLPILSSSAAARILYLFQFSAAILAAYSLDQLQKTPQILNKSLKLLVPLVILITFFVLARWQLSVDIVTQAQYKVSLRNLIIPTGLLGAATILYLGNKLKRIKSSLIAPAFFLLTIFDFAYFTGGYLPFTEPRFIFPQTPPFTYLQQNAGVDRFFGDYTASVTSNVWMPYNLYSPEGYDSLYLDRYGQLIHAAASRGDKPQDFPRSDADLPSNQDDIYRQRLQDLMGVKYLIHQIEPTDTPMQSDPGRFPPDRYQLLWEQDRYQIYQNLHSLPRVFLVPSYHVADLDQDILDLIFDPNWDFTHSVILETDPEIPAHYSSSPVRFDPNQPQIIPVDTDKTNQEIFVDPQPEQEANQPYSIQWIEASASATTIESYSNPTGDLVKILSYTSNRIEISIKSQTSQFLFLSDNYYPDWTAYIQETNTQIPIYRTNYTFRSVLIPAGEHTIVFKYQPQLFP